MRMKPNRILLIEPPFCRLFKDTYSLNRFPLSLGYLAGTIRKETDWDIICYNADFCFRSESIKVSYLASAGFDNYLNNLRDSSGMIWKVIKSTISEYKPSVVGISAKSQNFLSARIVAKLAKETDKQIIVIVGGPHPSMTGKDALNCSDIDICVKGEGEKTIVELLNAIAHQKELDAIRGIIFRKNARIIETPPREFIENLDSLSFPHEIASESLKDYNLYPLSAFGNIFATRGCPYNCFFCGSRMIWSRKVRFRSPQNVMLEIKNLEQKGSRLIHFADDTFGINKKYINDLCNALIIHCPKIKWSCELHVRLVDEQIISLMKRAGCYSVQIGIESGNNRILKEIRKDITIEEALYACKIIKKYGIELQVFFMVGFPQETEATLSDTVAAMKKTNCDVLEYSIFTPYPSTEAFELCKENGLIDDDYDVSLYNHQSPANCFCINITPDRFRMLVSKIEKMVDRKNSLNRIKRIFRLKNLRRMQELGIGKSFQKGIKVFLRK